jgi:drug/metabolite transporter (DMT)-like permease
MSIGLLLGLAAALCWGSTDVAAAFSGRRLGSLRVAALVQLSSLAAVLVLCVVRSSGLPAKPEDTLAALINGVVAAGAYIAFFTALRIGPVSVVSPVVAAYGGLTVVLAVLIRGETLTPLQALGAAIGTIGVILTGLISDGGWRQTRIVGRGVVFSLIAMACFAILTIGLAGPIRSAGWLPVMLGSRAANAATVWLVLGLVLAMRAPATAPLLAPAVDRPGSSGSPAPSARSSPSSSRSSSGASGSAPTSGWGSRGSPPGWWRSRCRDGRSPSGRERQPGRLNQNRVWPSAESAPTRPPPASTSCLTIASPMPAPPRARSRDFSTR